MGTSTARGRHAAPRTGLSARPTPRGSGDPSAAAGGRRRHARPSQVPAGSTLLTVTAGGLLAVATPVSGHSVATAAASFALQPSASPAPPSAVPEPTPAPSSPSTPTPTAAPPAAGSATTADARQTLADRASRSRRVLPVVTTPPTPRPVSTPVRVPLPGCTQPAVPGGANGQLDAAVLCDVGSGERLRADAARAFAALGVAYESRFGAAPCLIDGYRTLGEQQQLRRTKPRYAARPGNSEHGWGLAVDLGCGAQSRQSVQHAWLQASAPAFGWVNPDWARSGGSRPEPWHWEFGTADQPVS